MNSGISAKSIAVVFAAALVLYLSGFYGLEHLRHRKGPWTATFTTVNGAPAVEISQPALKISGVRLVFPGETVSNGPVTLRFSQPKPLEAVPFGRVIYEDLTFLPGVVTLDLFGHEVELVPRVLVVNKREVPWKSGAVIELSRAAKPPQAPVPPAERRR